VALAPAHVPHDLHNVGEGTLRVVGFFPSAAVVTVFEEEVSRRKPHVRHGGSGRHVASGGGEGPVGRRQRQNREVP
jgi:hypothetical protein